MRPTMSDVAKAASVSTSTVSRALSGDVRVKETTRRYIAEVAGRLGYTPNRTAAALRQGKTWMIGVVTPGTPRAFSDPFYLEFLGGLGDRAMEAGYNLVIAAPSGLAAEAADGSSPRGLDLEGLIAHGAVDAVALTEPAVDDPRLDVLRRYAVPFAFLGTPEESERHRADGNDAGRQGWGHLLGPSRITAGVSFVDGDNVGSSKEAVAHLIALGHTRIACFTGEAGLAATKQRLDGYLQAMSQAGLDVGEGWIVNGDATEQGGRRAMEQLLARAAAAPAGRSANGGDAGGARRPTAVFASNDLMAIGALRAARAAGLNVPQDVSIVGFDGIPTAELVEPPLTTVKQPIYTLGRRLAEVLLAQLQEEPAGPGAVAARREIVPGRLVVRSSTAAPGFGGDVVMPKGVVAGAKTRVDRGV